MLTTFPHCLLLERGTYTLLNFSLTSGITSSGLIQQTKRACALFRLGSGSQLLLKTTQVLSEKCFIAFIFFGTDSGDLSSIFVLFICCIIIMLTLSKPQLIQELELLSSESFCFVLSFFCIQTKCLLISIQYN